MTKCESTATLWHGLFYHLQVTSSGPDSDYFKLPGWLCRTPVSDPDPDSIRYRVCGSGSGCRSTGILPTKTKKGKEQGKFHVVKSSMRAAGSFSWSLNFLSRGFLMTYGTIFLTVPTAVPIYLSNFYSFKAGSGFRSRQDSVKPGPRSEFRKTFRSRSLNLPEPEIKTREWCPFSEIIKLTLFVTGVSASE